MKVMRFLEQKAQGMVEYALILAFVVAIAAGLTNSDGIKKNISDIFSQVNQALTDAKTKAE